MIGVRSFSIQTAARILDFFANGVDAGHFFVGYTR